MDNNQESSENLTKNITRLARREEIGRQINLSPTRDAREIIDKVRSNMPLIEQQIDDLVNQEFVISPRRRALVNEIVADLQDNFPDVPGIALLPLGSTINGGTVAREIMGQEKGSDLDWGILYDGPKPSPQRLKEMSEYVKSKIADLSTKHGLPNVISSSYVNPVYFSTSSLENSQQAISTIRAIDEDEWDPWDNALLFFLSPSVPEESNIQNRKLLLEGLSELSQSNHDLWQRTVDNISTSWESHRRLKSKHLEGSFTNSAKDNALRESILSNSGKVMSKPLKELLYATDRTKAESL